MLQKVLIPAAMLQSIKLLLPALIPSWRFFQAVGPSPRIEFRMMDTAQELAEVWQEFRPRPGLVSVSAMLQRIFFNPDWNQFLFLMSCAERLIQNPTEHSMQEISQCIRAGLKQGSPEYFQFRLIFISREDAALQKHVLFLSPVYKFKEDPAE